MADPFAGWRVLAKCLAPGGLMLIGLYSATSRRNLVALRGDPAYPGAGCDDAALRIFRQELLDRPDHSPGGTLKLSRDFYTTSNFRDLVLHVTPVSSTACMSSGAGSSNRAVQSAALARFPTRGESAPSTIPAITNAAPASLAGPMASPR